MAAPTNLTPATALVINTSPYTLTLDVSEAPTGTGYPPDCAGEEFAVWWKYVAQTGDVAVAFRAVKDTGGAGFYQPATSVWQGTLPSLTQTTFQLDDDIDPWCGPQDPDLYFQINVTPGTAYYFQVVSDSGLTPDADLVVDFVRNPLEEITNGDLLIPSDEFSWPAMVISQSADEILRIVNIPACEQGVVLPNSGIMCVAAEGAGTLFGDVLAFTLYNPGLGLIASVDDIVIPVQDPLAPVTSNRSNTFYVSVREGGTPTDPAVVYTLSTAGVVGGTNWTLPAASKDMTGMGLSPNEGILYWYTEVVASAVHRYDLVNDTALSDLVAGAANVRWGRDIIGLTSGDVLVMCRPTATLTSWVVRRYNSAGSLQATYTLPTSGGSAPRMALSIDGLSFWAMTFSGDDTVLTQVLISSGATLTTRTIAQRSPGKYANEGDVAFGPAQSCPVMVVRNTSNPPLPEGTAFPSRRVRRFALPYAGNKYVFISRLEFIFQPGEGYGTGQGQHPVAMIRISGDGGRTWGTEQWLTAGDVGEYGHRMYAYQLGRHRDPWCELTVTDPNVWYFIDCYADISEGTS